MKITRFAQSCILIETSGKRILLDPGYIQYRESYPDNEWKNIDILLVTHKHADHCHIDAVKNILKNSKTRFYTTREVADTYPEISPDIVKAGDVLNFDDIKAEVVNAVHGYIPFIKGNEVVENAGYIIDDGKHRVYQTSDTICFKNNYRCDVLFVPVSDHRLVMGPFEASLFTKETGAKLVIPFHYDNPKYPADKKEVEKHFNMQGLNFKFLDSEETIEI